MDSAATYIKIIAQMRFVFCKYNFHRQLLDKLSLSLLGIFEDVIEYLWCYLVDGCSVRS